MGPLKHRENHRHAQTDISHPQQFNRSPALQSPFLPWHLTVRICASGSEPVTADHHAFPDHIFDVLVAGMKH
jgi:hypothetical protein